MSAVERAYWVESGALPCLGCGEYTRRREPLVAAEAPICVDCAEVIVAGSSQEADQ